MKIGVRRTGGELLSATGFALRVNRAWPTRRARAEVLAAPKDELCAANRVASIPLFVGPGAGFAVHDRGEHALGRAWCEWHGDRHAVRLERCQELRVRDAGLDAAHSVAAVDEVDLFPRGEVDELVRLGADQTVLAVRVSGRGDDEIGAILIRADHQRSKLVRVRGLDDLGGVCSTRVHSEPPWSPAASCTRSIRSTMGIP